MTGQPSSNGHVHNKNACSHNLEPRLTYCLEGILISSATSQHIMPNPRTVCLSQPSGCVLGVTCSLCCVFVIV